MLPTRQRGDRGDARESPRDQPRPPHRPRRVVPRPRGRRRPHARRLGPAVRGRGAGRTSEFVAQIERRLALVPRYRQKLAFPPLVQSRPVWVDDPHFNAGYHVRHTALPEPAGEAELRRLAGRVFAQRLDRSKPLWELWLVDRVGDDRFALITKTHHCAGRRRLRRRHRDGAVRPRRRSARRRRRPSRGCRGPSRPPATLLADALVERASTPVSLARAAAGARQPRRRPRSPPGATAVERARGDRRRRGSPARRAPR